MQSRLTRLRALHAELLAALDQGDVAAVRALVQERAEQLAALQAEFGAAAASDRTAIQPALRELLPLDRQLQDRATGLRDELRSELDRQA